MADMNTAYYPSIIPDELYVDCVITTRHSTAEHRYYYVMDYTTTLVFDSDEELIVYVPLAKGNIEDLTVSVNREVISDPEVKSNTVIVDLNGSTLPASVEVHYVAQGRDSFSHKIPTDGFMKRFQMSISVINSQGETVLVAGSLTPDVYKVKDNRWDFQWDKENTVLKQNVALEIPTPVDDDQVISTAALLTMVIVIAVLAIIIALIMFFYIRPRYLKNGRAPSPKKLSKKVKTLEANLADTQTMNQELLKRNEHLKEIRTHEKRYCPYCQSELILGSDYCSKCGGNITNIKKCNNCGALKTINEHQKFCSNCGM
jgi:hypothetical protein